MVSGGGISDLENLGVCAFPKFAMLPKVEKWVRKKNIYITVKYLLIIIAIFF